MARVSEDWELLRPGGPYDWALSNTSGKSAKQVYVEFEGVVDGRRWREGVTPASGLDAVGVFRPEQTVFINIDRSDTVDKVSVRWKSGFRTRTWETTDL